MASMSPNVDAYEGELPDFLHIGAAKAGSSWIFEILNEHPEIFVPVAKDISFFDHQYDLGLQWYMSHFRNAGDKVKGEVAHDYFLSKRYAERIASTCPNVKLTVCLREPVSRIVSRYRYALTTEFPANTSFSYFLQNSSAIRESSYVENLRPFYALFPRDHIKVFFFDDLNDRPSEFVRELYGFIGVDTDFQPSTLTTVVRPARRARIPVVGRLAWQSAKWLRRRGKANWVGAVKRHPIFNRLMYDAEATSVYVPQHEVDAVRTRFEREIPELERLIDRPVPPAWGDRL